VGHEPPLTGSVGDDMMAGMTFTLRMTVPAAPRKGDAA